MIHEKEFNHSEWMQELMSQSLARSGKIKQKQPIKAVKQYRCPSCKKVLTFRNSGFYCSNSFCRLVKLGANCILANGKLAEIVFVNEPSPSVFQEKYTLQAELEEKEE